MTDRTTDKRLRDFSADSRVLSLTLVAALIGVVGTLAALALVRLIGLFTNILYYHRLSTSFASPAHSPLGLWVIPIPIAGGVIVGLMARYGSEKIRGHGIPEAMEAILQGQSRIQPNVAILKPLSSALAIGSGGPFGAEGPIIMTGGACGSLVAQAFHLSAAERKTLLAAGAAAGMAAIFAAPLAAVVLAIELLLFEWKPRSFIPVAAASAVAGALRIPLLGAGPTFPLALTTSIPASFLAECVAIGLVAGAAAALLTELLHFCEDLFARLPIHWTWWPALGGVAIAAGGLLFPRALGVGYETIEQMVRGDSLGTAVLGLLLVKALMWAVALGSGTSGGVLAPLLFMGGALGTVEANWVHASPVGLWAALGMGAMMAGTMQIPLTTIVFVVELTGDVALMPPLLVACVTASALTVLLMRRSILTGKLARRGQHVTREYIVNPLHLLRVHDVMERDVPTIPADMPADALLRRLATEDGQLGRRSAWPIVDTAGTLVGILTRGDLARALESVDDDATTKTVLDVGSRPPIVTFPDDILETAAATMLEHGIGRVLVVRREDPTRLVGILGRSGIMAAWLHVARDERDREPGWLSDAVAALRGAMRRVAVRERA